MLMSAAHATAFDQLEDRFGKVLGQASNPATALQALVLLGRHEHEVIATLLGDGNRLLQRLVAQGAERAVKFARRDAYFLGHFSSIRKMRSLRKSQVFIPLIDWLSARGSR